MIWQSSKLEENLYCSMTVTQKRIITSPGHVGSMGVNNGKTLQTAKTKKGKIIRELRENLSRIKTSKFIFLLWCFAPVPNNGSVIIYENYIRTMFLRNVETLDRVTDMVTTLIHKIVTKRSKIQNNTEQDIISKTEIIAAVAIKENMLENEDVNFEETVKTSKTLHRKGLKAVKNAFQYFEPQGVSVMDLVFLRRLRDEAT
ncbi:hypothetical protein TNCV_1483081 [Trichonephila clavipes]|nr:hypothetical protein TNCV_1483081 [Trichonephila clavipes]